MTDAKRKEREAREAMAAWMDAFRQKVIDQRIPMSGTLELTSRCNLRCVHCYLGSQDAQHARRDDEMSTEEVKRVVDEMVAAGCLYLLITGGDPMMRKDFVQVYTHAKRSGLLVTVFCDGVLVRDHTIALFKDLPPKLVEVSLYGATRETYEKVTQVPGSFDECLAGIERLVDAGINTGLKTVLMTLNAHELDAMRAIADKHGLPFRFDSAIFPCLPNGAKDPMGLRVDPEASVAEEMKDPEAVRLWRSYHERKKDLPARESLYTCGAGVTGFYVGPKGELSPCLMTPHHSYSLREGSFADHWSGRMTELHAKRPGEGYGCNTCEIRTLCTGCPAFNMLETGKEDEVSQYVCETTKARWNALMGEDPKDVVPARRSHKGLKILA